MTTTEEQEKPTEKLLATAGQMIETYRDLVSLTVVENASMVASVSVVGVVSLVFSCFALLFGALGLAWWIGESMNNMKAGFFIAGSIFLFFLVVVLLLAKNTLMPMIRDMIIKKAYEKD